MKTFLRIFGGLALALGVIAVMGSANDCDGKCMEMANDLPTMLMVIGYGVLSIIGGVACLRAAEYF